MPSSNSVTLTGSMIKGLEYIGGSFVVTTGESASPPPTFSLNGNTWTITIAADRKKSAAVATSFNNAVGGPLHEAADGGGAQPDELNFYFGVYVAIQTPSAGVVQVPLYLGQGNYSLTNNWWIGGNTFLSAPKYLLAISNNQVQSILNVKLSTSAFTFST